MLRIVIEAIHLAEHPFNPKLKIGHLRESRQVVVGDHYQEGQLGFFVPEGAIVGEKLLREMWLWNEERNRGRLAGKKGNRVKARIMEQVMSDGLWYGSQGESWQPHWIEGLIITEALDIVLPE